MKDYKRLTDKYYPCVVCKNGKCLEQQYDCEEREVCEAWNRLFQLENKIESGEIDYVADKDAEIARLTAENAELKNRLDNAIELPRLEISPYDDNDTLLYYLENGHIQQECFNNKFPEQLKKRLAELKGEDR